jgi:hypothetical protein
MANRSFLLEMPKRIKALFLALLTGLSIIISNVLSKWFYEFLVSSPNTPQVLLNVLSFKRFSFINLFLIIAVFSIPLFYFNSRLRKERLNIQKKVEKDLAEFVFDVFESHLDDQLVKIIEETLGSIDVTLESNNNSSIPFNFIDKLCNSPVQYFGFAVASMTIFQLDKSDKSGEYLIPTVSIPPDNCAETKKDALRFYIGNDRANLLGQGLVTFVYQKQELVKIHVNLERSAVRVRENGIIEPFPQYRNIRVKESIGVRSIAAIPLCRRHNKETVVLGVLCVDSSVEEAFKTSEYDDELNKVARCLAIAIEIQDLLEELH